VHGADGRHRNAPPVLRQLYSVSAVLGHSVMQCAVCFVEKRFPLSCREKSLPSQCITVHRNGPEKNNRLRVEACGLGACLTPNKRNSGDKGNPGERKEEQKTSGWAKNTYSPPHVEDVQATSEIVTRGHPPPAFPPSSPLSGFNYSFPAPALTPTHSSAGPPLLFFLLVPLASGI